MKIIFCLSNLNAAKTISVLGENPKDYQIIVREINLYNFFSNIYDANNITLLKPQFPISKKPYRLIQNCYLFLKQRMELLRWVRTIKDADIYAFFVAYCEIESWLLLKLIKHNNVYCYPSVTLNSYETVDSVYSKLGLLVRKLLFHSSFRPVLQGRFITYMLRDIFFEKFLPLKVDFINTNLVSNIVSDKFDVPDAKVLVLIGGVIPEFQEEHVYNKITKNIYMKLINLIGQNQIVAKCHPRNTSISEFEANFDIIEKSIPINTCVDKFQLIIGYSSYALCELATENTISISLIDMFTNKDAPTIHNLKKYIIANSEHKILFPKDVHEFTNILKKFEF